MSKRVKIITKENGETIEPRLEIIDLGDKRGGFWDGFVGGDKDNAYFGIDCKDGNEIKKAIKIIKDKINDNKELIRQYTKENKEYDELLKNIK